MEPQNIFSDKMNIGRPVFREFGFVRFKADTAQVSGQRVKPDVENVSRIIRQRYAPLQCRTAYRKIFQSALHERNDLVAARFRPDEIRILLIELKQSILKSRQLE